MNLAKVLVASCLMLLGVSGAARAYPIDGGVVWPFEGTVHFVGNWDACCDLGVGEGSLVTGAFRFTSSYPLGPPYVQYSGGVGLGSYGFGASVADGTFRAQDGNGSAGHPDLVGVINPYYSPAFLRPGWGIGNGSVQTSWQLRDDQGTAWNGLNPRTGDYLPDEPPSLDHFEIARLVLSLDLARYEGTTIVETGGGSIVVTVTRWLVPEPGQSLLAALGLLSLAALRSSAARTPRSRP